MNIQQPTFNIQHPVTACRARLSAFFGFGLGRGDKAEQFKYDNEAPLPDPLPILLRRLRKTRRGRNAPSILANRASVINPHKVKGRIEMSPARRSFIGRWMLDVGCCFVETMSQRTRCPLSRTSASQSALPMDLKSEVRIKKPALTPALSPRRGGKAPSVLTNRAYIINPHWIRGSVQTRPTVRSFGRWMLGVGCSMFFTIA